MKPTEEWLKEINERFRKMDMPPRERPFVALKIFSQESKCAVSLSSEIAITVFEWFYQNTQTGSHKIGSLYRGVYYFDSCFWPVYVPIIYGQVAVNAFDSLQTMPSNFKSQINADRKELEKFILLWADCFDYAYGYDDIIKDSKFSELANSFIKSANKELCSTVSLLLQDSPESKAMESARMSVEMFLKSVCIISNNWEEGELKKRIGHNLTKAAEEAFKCTHREEIKAIEGNLLFYPKIEVRYSGKSWKHRDLWKGYCIAQAVAAIFARVYSDRDIKKSFFDKKKTVA